MPHELLVSGLKPGQRYRIVFIQEGAQLLREAVLTYVGTTGDESILAFSARPLNGTVNIETAKVRELWETERPLLLPDIYRGETRVF